MFANSTLLKIFMDLAQKFTKNNEISAILYAFVWIALVFCMSFVSFSVADENFDYFVCSLYELL